MKPTSQPIEATCPPIKCLVFFFFLLLNGLSTPSTAKLFLIKAPFESTSVALPDTEDPSSKAVISSCCEFVSQLEISDLARWANGIDTKGPVPPAALCLAATAEVRMRLVGMLPLFVGFAPPRTPELLFPVTSGETSGPTASAHSKIIERTKERNFHLASLSHQTYKFQKNIPLLLQPHACPFLIHAPGVSAHIPVQKKLVIIDSTLHKATKAQCFILRNTPMYM